MTTLVPVFMTYFVLFFLQLSRIWLSGISRFRINSQKENIRNLTASRG